MRTQISNNSEDSGDIISYAKWFAINELKFSLDMLSPNQWIAKAKVTDIFIETSINKGPVSALMELHKIAKRLLVVNE
jgi:hypothetical protein